MKLPAILESSQFLQPKLAPGSYSAVVGGYESVAAINGQHLKFKFPRGVRGFNIADTIVIDVDGNVSSQTLGSGGKLDI